MRPKTQKIRRAKQFAKQIHHNHKRLSGEGYYEHVLEVHNKLKEANVQDESVLIAALLHHALDYSEEPAKEITKEFGEDILQIVELYKKLSKAGVKRKSPKQINEKYLIQTYLNLAKDMRVLLIRLADKTVNIQSAFVFSKEERTRLAERALNLYAPICRLLGGIKFTSELENGAFKILYPEQYYKIERTIQEKLPEIDNFFKESVPFLRSILRESNINATVRTRIKHIYGIQRKAVKYQSKGIRVGPEFENIYDIAAMRVLVDSVEDCYKVEDILKQLWECISEERDDYIQTPRQTGYKGLHNTFKVSDNLFIEVQIRTYEMHEENEFGSASHVFYKIGDKFKKKLEQNPDWLKEINFWEHEGSGDTNDMKITQFSDSVYAFTPKGDIIQLPKGATALDFAYSVHSTLGHQCIGALVNGEMVKLNYEVNDGDQVEMKTLKSKKKPSPDWLYMVKTKKAKDSIRKALGMTLN